MNQVPSRIGLTMQGMPRAAAPRHLPGLRQSAALAILVLLVLVASGCQDSPVAQRKVRRGSAVEGVTDTVAKAIEYLERLDDFEESSAFSQAAYQLNRWIDEQKVDSSWQPDPLIERLPRTVREQRVADSLGRRRFDPDDVRYLQECVWTRQVSGWVSQQPVDPLLAPWLTRRKSEIGEFPGEQLEVAYRLFDWVVRNIQLDPLLASPDEATAAPAAGAGTAGGTGEAALPAALRGLPGPGYRIDPGQALLLGHGDAWVRMRVLTLLARQRGLDIVTLGFPGRTIPPRPRPWVAGLVSGEQLYLFDLRLGLPILGKDGASIATLSEVLAEPQLLDGLSGGEQHPYRVAAEDLKEIVALLDVTAPALSLRMELAEKQLVGAQRTTLFVPLTKLSERVRACRGISDVYVWSIPFEASWYRSILEQQMRNDPQVAAQQFLERGLFAARSPLVRGRIAYLRHDVEARDEAPGAKTLLMEARISEANLKRLATDEEMQASMGLNPNLRREEQKQAQIAMFQDMLTLSKQHASFWLGMCQLESGRPDAAVEWLQARSLDVWPDGPWSPLARYNLARTHELRGDFEGAQKLLLADKSLQEHGNFLRARLLQARIAPPSAPPSPSANATAP